MVLRSEGAHSTPIGAEAHVCTMTERREDTKPPAQSTHHGQPSGKPQPIGLSTLTGDHQSLIVGSQVHRPCPPPSLLAVPVNFRWH
jgi:hypothetical protein